MVKTRHTPDDDDESTGNFLSLESRRTRLAKVASQKDEEASDDSGVIQFRKKQSQTRSPEAEPSITKRSPRAAAKRVSYVEDFIDEGYPTRRSGRRTRRTMLDDDDEEVKMTGAESGPEEDVPSVQRRSSQKQCMSELDSEEKSPRFQKLRSRQQRTVNNSIRMAEKQFKREELDEMEESGIRRSKRARKAIYDNLDQKILQGHFDGSEPDRKRRRENVDTDDGVEESEEYKDMYSRVKRKRVSIKRDMYGMPMEESDEGEANEEEDEEEDSDDNDEENEDDEDDDNNDDNENKEGEKKTSRSYYLRENKPRTQLYNAPLHEKRTRTQSRFFNDEVTTPNSPARRRRSGITQFMSPARRRMKNRHRKTFHRSSSTSSSSTDSSSDEERFQRRKSKSMMKARQRCLPMNFDPDDISKSMLLRDRQKIGSSLADVDPMNIDRSVTFDSVGGLGKHIRALKEMVVFPLLYPEIFERFKISPPRGVLFYGPPGTGKTLVARALANECSSDDRRVAFYMRKGADCLSKWVGESERQLRLLFDQAYQTRPSIIFFDEIDGLAPVRSSRQDQIHSSIVSTLLALMDGLDSRGEIVVIGATNRIDSIDPALRRPGRFDREFLFPLPSLQARQQILKINTKEWNPRLCDKFVAEVAEKCVGYCGADVKALCTEAALLALRRRYPQIYTSSEKLQIDVSSIRVSARDFFFGMKNIVPTSQRSVTSPARALSSKVAPLVSAQLTEALAKLNDIFPAVLSQLANLDTAEKEEGSVVDSEQCSDEEEHELSIYEQKLDKRRRSSNIPATPESFMNFTSYAHRHPSTDRPRLLLCGDGDQGQSSHIAPGVLHHLEQLPVHVLDLPALFAVSARSPEEACAQIFREARRTSPSIIYLPHINQWWSVVGETVKATFLTLIQDVDPSCPLLLLATSEEHHTLLDFSLQDLFDDFSGEVITMRNPCSSERQEFFKDLLLNQTTRGPPQHRVAAKRILEVLPKAPPPEPKKLSSEELKKLVEIEEATLTELRLFLRDTLNKLGRDRKFFIFTKPVDIEDVPDYYDIIKKPMDLSTMMSKIDLHHYQSVKEFLADITQICLNALEYNPDRDPQSRVIRHRACALKDMAYSIIKTELDPEFEKTCEGIVESRKQRGEDSSKSAPSFYHTRPLNTDGMHPLAITKNRPVNTPSPQVDTNVRTSRRLHGAEADEVPSLEEVERTARAIRSLTKRQNSPDKHQQQCSNESTPQGQIKKETSNSVTSSGQRKSQDTSSSGKILFKGLRNSGSSNKKTAKKSIWGRSSYRSRRRRWMRKSRSASDGDEVEAEVEDKEEEEEEEENGDGDEEEEMEAGESTAEDVSTSPRHELRKSPRGDAQSDTSSQLKNAEQTSVSDCLTIDVNMKSPKDVPRSPNQKSPRSASCNQRSQLSPHQSSSLRSPRGDTTQKSPRQRSPTGPKSSSHQDAYKPQSSSSLISHHRSTEKLTKLSPRPVQDHDENSNHTSPQENLDTSQEQTNSVKTDGVQIVVGDFVDSGIGSSDSNGDSNDSASKLLASVSNSGDQAGSGTIIAQTKGGNISEEPEMTEDVDMNEKSVSPQQRMTRSRLQTKTQEKAYEILQSPIATPVVVDRERLVRLLDLTVLLTEGYNVGQLEKLHCLYGQCVYQHRLDTDKTVLIELMEKRLKQFTSSVAERRKREKAASQHIS